MSEKLSLLGQSLVRLTKAAKKYAPAFLALALLFAFAAAPYVGPALAGAGKGANALFSPVPTTPTLNIDFEAALVVIFDYASMIFAALIGIAAIGIGFNFGLGLIGWVSKMISQAVKF
jgi:hypothetical protein